MSGLPPELEAEIEERSTRLAEQLGHGWTNEQLAQVRALLIPTVRERRKRVAS